MNSHRKPSSRGASVGDKLSAMPFGVSPPSNIVFDLTRVLDDKRWSASGYARRDTEKAWVPVQIGNALRFYWVRRARQYRLVQLRKVESALRKYAFPLLAILDDETEGKTDTGLHSALSLMVGDGESHLQNLHIALRGVREAIGNSRSVAVAGELADQEAIEAVTLRKHTRLSATKAVGKLSDPAGHALAFDLIEPYMALSGKTPSGSPNSTFAQFLAAVEGAYLARYSQHLRQGKPEKPEREIARQRRAHTIKQRDDAVRWAVKEWKAKRKVT